MDTIEQKEKETIEQRKLTKFQKKQVLSLVDRFLEENEESKKEGFPTCPKCGTAHPVLTKAGRTKGDKERIVLGLHKKEEMINVPRLQIFIEPEVRVFNNDGNDSIKRKKWTINLTNSHKSQIYSY